MAVLWVASLPRSSSLNIQEHASSNERVNVYAWHLCLPSAVLYIPVWRPVVLGLATDPPAGRAGWVVPLKSGWRHKDGRKTAVSSRGRKDGGVGDPMYCTCGSEELIRTSYKRLTHCSLLSGVAGGVRGAKTDAIMPSKTYTGSSIQQRRQSCSPAQVYLAPFFPQRLLLLGPDEFSAVQQIKFL